MTTKANDDGYSPSFSSAELERLAVKHGVEDPRTAKNEMRYRRIEALLAEAVSAERAAHVADLLKAAKEAFELLDAQFRFRDLEVRDNLRAAIAQMGGWEIQAPAATSAHPEKRPCFAMQREAQEGGAA
jgi:hypothetical protein